MDAVTLFDQPANDAEPAPPPTRQMRRLPASTLLAPVARVSGQRDVPLLGLAARGACRYPTVEDENVVGLHLFCGAACDSGSSYCDGHRRRVFSVRPVGGWSTLRDKQSANT